MSALPSSPKAAVLRGFSLRGFIRLSSLFQTAKVAEPLGSISNNEAGPLIYHLVGNVVAFLAPCVLFVIGLHSSTVKSTLKPPYSTALLVIAFHDLSQHS